MYRTKQPPTTDHSPDEIISRFSFMSSGFNPIDLSVHDGIHRPQQAYSRIKFVSTPKQRVEAVSPLVETALHEQDIAEHIDFVQYEIEQLKKMEKQCNEEAEMMTLLQRLNENLFLCRPVSIPSTLSSPCLELFKKEISKLQAISSIMAGRIQRKLALRSNDRRELLEDLAEYQLTQEGRLPGTSHIWQLQKVRKEVMRLREVLKEEELHEIEDRIKRLE